MGYCIRGDRYRWPGAVVRYGVDNDFDDAEVRAIEAAMEVWSGQTPVTFKKYRPPQFPLPYVHFRPGREANACDSRVGMRYPGQPLYCDPTSAALTHEIGHALGLLHEQQRFDRDLFVTVSPDNVIAGKRGNFARRSIDEGIMVGAYDFGSIMHYRTDQFAVDFEVNVDVPRVSSAGAPAMAVFNDELHLAYIDGSRNVLHTWSSDLVTWERPVKLDQTSKAPPALAVFGRNLMLVHLGRESNDVWISRSTDGRTFSDNEKVEGVTSRNTPALVSHGNRLHLGFIGATDNQIRWSTSRNGRLPWSEPKKIGQTSKAAPAVTSDGIDLHLVHAGNASDDLWYSTSPDGESWSSNERIGQTSKTTPALAFADSQVHLTHLGESTNKIWHSKLVSDEFSTNRETNQLSRRSPALAAGTIGGTDEMILAHLGDTSSRIYVSRFNAALLVMRALQPGVTMGSRVPSAGDIAAVEFMYTD